MHFLSDQTRYPVSGQDGRVESKCSAEGHRWTIHHHWATNTSPQGWTCVLSVSSVCPSVLTGWRWIWLTSCCLRLRRLRGCTLFWAFPEALPERLHQTQRLLRVVIGCWRPGNLVWVWFFPCLWHRTWLWWKLKCQKIPSALPPVRVALVLN